MKKFYLFCIPLCLGIFSNAQTVTIGTGTNTSGQSPWDSYYFFSYVQTIYLASEINATGNITSIKYYYAGSALTNNQAIKVYMAHVSRGSFSSTTDWEALSNLTLVFDGNVGTPAVPGWITISLPIPFAYNGTANLLIAIDENTTGDNGSTAFRTTTIGTNRVLYYRTNDAPNNPDPAAPPTTGDAIELNRNSAVANIQIDGLTLGCQLPTAITGGAATTTTIPVSWTAPNAGPTPAGYQYELRTSGAAGSGPTGLVTSNSTATTSVNLTSLSPGTSYSFYIRTNCGGGNFSGWSAATVFATDCNPITTFPYTQSFDASPICWTATVISGNTNWAVGGSSTDISAPQSGAGYVYKPWNTSSANLYSAPFNLSSLGSTAGRISFWFYRHSITVAADEAKFYINTSKSTTGATQLITLKPLTTQAPVVPASGWYHYTAAIPVSFNTAGTVYFIVQATTTAGTSSYDIGVDEFTVEASPSCFAPTLLIATPTITTAAISWTASTLIPSGGYQWEIRTSGAGGSGSTGLVAAGSTAAGITLDNVSGLAGNTAYTLYVRANCGSGDFSSWSSTAFTTSVDCLAAPIITECTDVIASIPAGTGAWSFPGSYPNNSIGFSTPGRELLYRFTPTTTGVYYLNITATPGIAYIDYFYKPASGGCFNTGWIGIDDNDGIGKDAIGLLQAGVEYYILLDAESTTAAPTQTFQICKATTVAPSSLNACVSTVSLGGSIPANSTKIEYLIDVAGNLIASLDFSTVSNSVGSVTTSYFVNGNALRRDGNRREYLDRNFTITTGTAPASPVAVTLYFLNSELQTLINDPNDGIADVTAIGDLRVTKTGETCVQSNAVSSGGTLLIPTRTGAVDANVSYVTVQVPSFSTFYLHGGLTVLPANLLTFSGIRQGTINQLKWTVAQETDVQSYDVERSENGRTWSKAASVNSPGNTASQRSYSFTDNNISGIKQMYRLRQVDRDGSEKLSNTITITGSKPTMLTLVGLFPNPAVSKINLLVDAPAKDNVAIVLTDAVGRVVKTQKASVETGSNTLSLNITELAQGSYMVKITSEGNNETSISKFVKE